MTETKIDYEGLAQDALRGVVRTVLARVAQGEQLPGNHHFYISFNTNAEGVGVSKRLREQYPDEMTIVLQHRYWDLQVHDDRFEVKLTFNSIPERLVVPFTAIKVFFDPSVPYGLQFDSGGQMTADTLPLEPSSANELPPKRAPAKRARPQQLKEVPKDDGAGVPMVRPVRRDGGKPLVEGERPRFDPATKLPKPVTTEPPAHSAAAGEPEHPVADPASKAPGQVVRLDAFRKK